MDSRLKSLNISDEVISPSGYTMSHSTDGTAFAVPQFLVPATHSAFDGFQNVNSVGNNDLPKV